MLNLVIQQKIKLKHELQGGIYTKIVYLTSIRFKNIFFNFPNEEQQRESEHVQESEPPKDGRLYIIILLDILISKHFNYTNKIYKTCKCTTRNFLYSA